MSNPEINGGWKQALKGVPGLVSCVRWVRARQQESALNQRRSSAFVRVKVDDYLATHSLRKLHIGSGPHQLAGWLNTDYMPYFDWTVFLDGTKPFPLPDVVFDYVFSEHMIEHISFEEGQQMLREAHRVLKPGGKVRIATPNLQALVGLFNGAKTDAQRRYVEHTMQQYYPGLPTRLDGFVLNNFVRNWGHQFVYDPDTLKFALERAGFTEVRQCRIGDSDDEHLRGLESHGKQIGEEFNEFETMALEARKG